MISEEQYLQFSPYFAQEDVEKEDSRLKFLELLITLPQTVKNLLTSTETVEKIIKIGESFELDEFDIEALSLAVRKLATGEVPPVQGTNLIINEVGVPEEKAATIFNSIISEILAPVVKAPKQTPKEPFSRTPERPDLKIDPGTNKNNVVDLRNR